jgi:hypothetical protein
VDWARCAEEGEECSWKGWGKSGIRRVEVRYGADGKFATKIVPLKAVASAAFFTIMCDNATFGDPIFGVKKACDFRAKY